jgi:hypothetical protein
MPKIGINNKAVVGFCHIFLINIRIYYGIHQAPHKHTVVKPRYVMLVSESFQLRIVGKKFRQFVFYKGCIRIQIVSRWQIFMFCLVNLQFAETSQVYDQLK